MGGEGVREDGKAVFDKKTIALERREAFFGGGARVMSRVVLPQSRGTRSRTAHPKIPTRNGKGIEEGGDWVVCGKTSEMGEGGGKKEVKTTEQERYHVVVNDDGSGERKRGKREKRKKEGGGKRREVWREKISVPYFFLLVFGR